MAKYGYYGASVERIAKAVGISNSALYQHFEDREEVLLAAADVLGERAHDWITATEGATAAERLDRINESHRGWAERSLESFVRPMFAIVGVSERARLEPSTPRGVLASYGLLLPIVEEGQRDGSIRADVEAADLAWAMLMFAWAEDMALLSNVVPVTQGGAGRRNFARLLSAYRVPQTLEDTAGPGSTEEPR